MTLSVGNLSLNSSLYTSSNTNALVSNAEMMQIANEILSAAPKTQPTGITNSLTPVNPTIHTNDNTVKVFGVDSANAQTIKQIAANRANLDVALNQQTLSAIQALKSNAASITNISNKLDGKIYIPAENTNTEKSKSIFSADNRFDITPTGDLNKDKRGSNPFSVVNISKKESKDEEKEGLNIFA